jgi:hypothetical protein
MDPKVTELATRLGITVEAAQQIYQAGLLEGERRSVVQSMQPNAKEIPLTRDLYARAYGEGMNLSTYLEKIDPSSRYNDGLDAFQRQLMLADIRTRSDVLAGVPAHPVERFWRSERPGSEVLFPEWCSRVWRQAALGGFAPEQTQRFYQSSAPISNVLHPAYLQQQIRQRQIAPAIPLSELVATVTTIDSGVYQAFYLTEDQDERRMRRVAEGAEVPTAILTGGDHTIRMRKYGRALEASYEAIRRTPIDRLGLHLGLLAVQAEVDKVTTAVDVAINGDGNLNTAATNTNQTAGGLDPNAVPANDTLTLAGYLAWRMLWANPYVCNVILARSAYVKQALMLNMGSANAPFFQLVGNFQIGGFRTINPGLDQAAIGWLQDAEIGAHIFLGMDNRFGLEMVVEAGSSMTETDKIISQQFNQIVITESVGFCVFHPRANRTITVNA